MISVQIPGAEQVHNNPEILRQARLRRFGMSDATARAIAQLAYGEPLDEPWYCTQLDTVVTTAIDASAQVYEARP